MPKYVVELKDLAQDKVSFEGSLPPGELDFDAEGARQVEPIIWKATAERAGEEIRIAGSLRTSLEISCSRCLELAQFPLSKEFDLFFRQQDHQMFDEDENTGEIELSEEDTRTAFFTGTELALGDVLQEQVLLALPMKALCRVDCKGLCPTCGTNLNINKCNCPDERFSPHMDKLLDIKRKLEERSS